MVKLNGHEYTDWRHFISSTFAESNKYERIEEGLHGDTFLEKYISLDKSNQTEIKVGYLNDTLIWLKYDNPLTAGYNQQQDREYFYRYNFTPGKSYGSPGLEFIDANVQGIEKQLCEGLKGKEIQYFQDGQLIKSEVFIHYKDNQDSYPNTIYFIRRSFWKKLKNIFSESANETQLLTKEIDLGTIFNGLK